MSRATQLLNNYSFNTIDDILSNLMVLLHLLLGVPLMREIM